MKDLIAKYADALLNAVPVTFIPRGKRSLSETTARLLGTDLITRANVPHDAAKMFVYFGAYRIEIQHSRAFFKDTFAVSPAAMIAAATDCRFRSI